MTPRPQLIIRPLPPFRLDYTVWALRRRPHNIFDRWDGAVYRRVVVIGSRVTELAVRQSGSPAAPRVTVRASPPLRTPAERRQVRSILDRLLGLQVDLSGWYRLARRDRRLAELADRFRGVKPPRFPTVFEALVNAVACQQLSLSVGLAAQSPRRGVRRRRSIRCAHLLRIPRAARRGESRAGRVSRDWIQPPEDPCAADARGCGRSRRARSRASGSCRR